MSAQGISASGQDAERLEAKPASPVRTADAPDYGLGVSIPHSPSASSIFIITVLLWLIPLSFGVWMGWW